MEIRELAAVVATVLATVGALPQLRRLLTSRDVAGLSISSAALGVATEVAWVGYTVHQGLWLAVPEAVMMASTNELLAVVMLRAGAPGRRALLSGIAWAATLIATCAVWGSIGLPCSSPSPTSSRSRRRSGASIAPRVRAVWPSGRG